MISTGLARRLRDAGLRWKPASGDRFQIDRPDFDADIFTISELTIEAHEYPTGTALGFNGTTEWALDSVEVDDALWLPREDQLRDLLRATFRRLERTDEGYRVVIALDGAERVVENISAPEAYGLALLVLLERVAGDGEADGDGDGGAGADRDADEDLGGDPGAPPTLTP